MVNLSDFVGFAFTVATRYKKETYSNSQRKTHKIAQIRHVEPQKRHTTIEVGLHLFRALT